MLPLEITSPWQNGASGDRFLGDFLAFCAPSGLDRKKLSDAVSSELLTLLNHGIGLKFGYLLGGGPVDLLLLKYLPDCRLGGQRLLIRDSG